MHPFFSLFPLLPFPKQLRIRASGVLLLTWLAGCTTLPYGHKDGERPATVIEIGRTAELIARRSDTCPTAHGDEVLVLLRYTGNSNLRWRAFPLPPGVDVKEGDRVLLDVNACRFTKMESAACVRC